MPNPSGLTVQDFRPIEQARAARVLAALNGATVGMSAVVRPGGPVGENVFATLREAIDAMADMRGLKTIQFDDTYVSPIVVAPGLYDTNDVEFYGKFDFAGANFAHVQLGDGVVFTALPFVTYGLMLHCTSTTVPVVTFRDAADLIVLDFGGKIVCDPGATQPFVRIPGGLADTSVIAVFNGGTLGSAGNHCVEIDAGATCLIVLSTFAELPDDVLAGAGTAFVAIDAGSVQSNTVLPINQPAVGVLLTVDFTSALYSRFTNLTAANWAGAAPTNVEDAVERMATLLKALNGGVAIP